MIGDTPSQLLRVSRQRPCPICGKHDWCSVSEDGAIAICPRTEQGAIRRCGDAGWLHILGRSVNGLEAPRYRKVTLARSASWDRGFDELVASSIQQATDAHVASPAARWGVSSESLRRLGIGWDGRAWTSPMRDSRARIIGVRRRFPSGTKRALRGSRNGLFLPTGLPPDGFLLIAEGESDCAALLTLGLDAIGRPSCTAGTKYIHEFARGRDVVVLADRDEPGLRGATRLASAIACVCPTVRIVAPPEGHEDVRTWVHAGATRDDIVQAIEHTPEVRLQVRARPARRKAGAIR